MLSLWKGSLGRLGAVLVVAAAVGGVNGVLARAAEVRAAVPVEAAFSFDRTPGRLPKDVVPVEYRIAIVPDVVKRSIAGRETVTLDVRRPTSRIAFNTLNETLRDVRLDGALVRQVRTENDRQLTTLTLAHPLARGRHTLALAYDGRIEMSPQGLFEAQYRAPDGKLGLMLSTQFEATDARRMFPCWDEPAFRATFQLSATVPLEWTAVSNTPVASRSVAGTAATYTFARTPKMSSYLVELSAGDLGHVEAVAGGVRHGVWAVRGREEQGRYALANSQQILADYDAYFGLRYPLPKLDAIAVPGNPGAMENWGAITYNEQGLLLGPEAPVSQKRGIYSVQAHEMAHQWFGDLVTMAWWDDLWLNESFATWMAAKETALRNPTWNALERADANKESAMNADARLSSHPMRQPVTNELQAENAFDNEITYGKGAAVLRMLEAYLGEDTFRSGLQRYVAAHRYSNATGADLWNALAGVSGTDVGAVAAGWTEQPGFPIVSVSAACDAAGNRTVTFRQQRFVLGEAGVAGRGIDQRWTVPMMLRSGSQGTVQRVLVRDDGQTATAGHCGEPLSANAGDTGYYRVAYDAATLEADRAAFATLPESDKIALLDDQWAQFLGGAAPLGDYLPFVSALPSGANATRVSEASNVTAIPTIDLDERLWQQVSTALGTLEHDLRGTPQHDQVAAYARGALLPAYLALGWDAKPGEAPPRRELRATVIEDLGAWGDRAVIAEAMRLFRGFTANRSSLSPEDRRMVLGVVGVNADRATFDMLHSLAKSAPSPQEAQAYYNAIASVRDPDLAREALEIAASSEIPPQSARLRRSMVGIVAANNPAVAWKFLQAHVNELYASETDAGRMNAMANVPLLFWDAGPLDQVEAWVRPRLSAEAAPAFQRATVRARSEAAIKAHVIAAAQEYLAAHPLAAPSTPGLPPGS